MDRTDEVSNHTYGKATLTWFEEIFEEYNMNLIYEARSYETWLQLEKGE
ncbi:hypothetical protein [Streptococcus pneumoniae]|nr:hypothetical protein [Streptococcus pneumoniae]